MKSSHTRPAATKSAPLPSQEPVVPLMTVSLPIHAEHIVSMYNVTCIQLVCGAWLRRGGDQVGRPRDASIDRAAIDACVALLGEVGRQQLSREKIARRAGVSLPAVNRRFDNVDDVLLAVASTPMYDPSALPGVDSLRSYLVASLTRTARTFAQAPIRRSASELLAAAAGDERIGSAVRHSVAGWRAEGLAWVKSARERGEVAPEVDGEALLDLANGAVYYRLLWRGQVISEDEVEPLVDLILNGAAPPSQ